MKGPQDQLPTVPFKTLDMIQEANKERLVFLELFNFLEEVKMSSSYIGEMDLRLIVVIKGIAYIKKNTEDSLHIIRIRNNHQLKKNAHYIILLRNIEEEQEDDLAEKILLLLNQKAINYEIQDSKNSLYLLNRTWKLEQILKTNLNVSK
ncbi:hypothetical protein A5881_001738 [Enterococcus termitis]|nr:hypothetical protein A5881_001946 [Enterococcus termitis]